MKTIGYSGVSGRPSDGVNNITVTYTVVLLEDMYVAVCILVINSGGGRVPCAPSQI